MKIIYTVIAYRLGKNYKHSYILGVFDDIDLAKDCANSHFDYRGGKYDCVVEASKLNKFNNNDDDYTLEIYRASK